MEAGDAGDRDRGHERRPGEPEGAFQEVGRAAEAPLPLDPRDPLAEAQRWSLAARSEHRPLMLSTY